jgi:hypothetical protein
MTDKLPHQGVEITIDRLAECKWRWAVSPPAAVRSLRKQSGEVLGDRADAMRVARRAIEAQTGTP